MRPIHLACGNGHFDVVKLLISINCDVVLKNEVSMAYFILYPKFNQDNFTLANIVCQGNQNNILQLPLVKKCDINAKNEVCSFAIDEYSDFSYYFQSNQTPIEIAFYSGHENIVKLLLANNCDMEFYNVIIVDIINITSLISGDNSQRKLSICFS